MELMSKSKAAEKSVPRGVVGSADNARDAVAKVLAAAPRVQKYPVARQRHPVDGEVDPRREHLSFRRHGDRVNVVNRAVFKFAPDPGVVQAFQGMQVRL